MNEHCKCPLCALGIGTKEIAHVGIGTDMVLITSASNAAALVEMARALGSIEQPVLVSLEPPKPPEITPEMIMEFEPRKPVEDVYIPPRKKPGESGAFYEGLLRRKKY